MKKIYKPKYSAENIFSEDIQKFLKQNPYELSDKDKMLWFQLKRDMDFYNEKIGGFRGKLLILLGYDLNFIGYKDPKTKKSASFYSAIYAKQHDKEPSRFKTIDSFCAFKKKIISEQINYGFIQKEISNVLWLDLDCHDDALYEYYVKIRDFLLQWAKHYMVYETKNNDKGTHIWLFLDKQLSSKDRRTLHKIIQVAVSKDLQIPLDICKKVIDTPKSWFRVPGTPDYLPPKSNPYIWHAEFCHCAEMRPLLPIRHDLLNPERTKELPRTEVQTNNVEQLQAAINAKIDIIAQNGLSKDAEFEELKFLVAYLYYKGKFSDVQKIAPALPKLGNGKGTAEILSDIPRLFSRVQELINEFTANPLSDSELLIFLSKIMNNSLQQNSPEIEAILKNGLSKGCSFNELGVIVPYFYYKCKITDVDSLLEKILSMGDGKGTAEVLSNKVELRSRIESLVNGCRKFLKPSQKTEWIDTTNWRDNLSEEQRKAEIDILNQFCNKNKHSCKKYGVSVAGIMSLVDKFLSQYVKITDFTYFRNLSGNMSSFYIAKHFNLTGNYYGVCKKIARLCSNLYGFHLVIDNDGKYYIPGTICSRYLIIYKNSLVSKKDIVSAIGQSILDFQEMLKETKMNKIIFKVVKIKSLTDKIDSIEIATQQDMKKYEKCKEEKLNKIHPQLSESDLFYKQYYDNMSKAFPGFY